MQDMLNFMPEHTLDKVDRAIVAKLQEDGRMANVDLADAVAMSQILTIPSVVEARSTFAIRTIMSRGPLPLGHWR